MIKETTLEWRQCDTHLFWEEIAPSNHLVQIYESEEVIINSLLGFVSSGFRSEESVVVIATADHLLQLDTKLRTLHFDVDHLIKTDQYIPLNAYDMLSSFMSVGWPNRSMFIDVVEKLMVRARGKNNRKVRAYGEMVAILWGQGFSGATVQLEHLWNEFCKKEILCLFCAYPKSGFTQDVHKSIGHICSTHTKIISGDIKSEKEVFYKSV